MKNIVLLIAVLVVSACATLTPEEKKIIGTYELKYLGDTHIFVFCKRAILESYNNGRKQEDHKWKIVDGELHLLHQDGNVEVARINSYGSISFIAFIVHWGKRYDLSKKKHGTWKKSNSSMPSKRD